MRIQVWASRRQHEWLYAIALKDLNMITALTESLNVPAPMSKQAASLYQILISKGYAELDLISILKVIDPKEQL